MGGIALMKMVEGGGDFPGGARGREGVCGELGNVRGGGEIAAKYFLKGRNVHQDLVCHFLEITSPQTEVRCSLLKISARTSDQEQTISTRNCEVGLMVA